MNTEFHHWYGELQAQRTVQALKKNNFDARYFPKAAEALEAFWGMVPEGASVGIGGSITLNHIGFFDAAQKRPIRLINPFAKGLAPEAVGKMRREMEVAPS